jgi:hypothetical protein
VAKGHGQKRGRKWEQAIAALLSEPTVEQAAARARVSYSSLKLWLTLPEFQEAYFRARQEVLERTVARLLSLCGKATETLGKNLEAESGAVANRAAELVLAQALKGVEALDLARRVEALERERQQQPQEQPQDGRAS